MLVSITLSGGNIEKMGLYKTSFTGWAVEIPLLGLTPRRHKKTEYVLLDDGLAIKTATTAPLHQFFDITHIEVQDL